MIARTTIPKCEEREQPPSSKQPTMVIVGNGMVGHALVEKLVQLGIHRQQRIVVFGEEQRAAYDRVNLSKFFDGETADTLDQRRDICLATLLFEQHQITLPVAKLAAMGHIVRAEQETDIAVKTRLPAFAGTARSAVLAMQRQVPP